MRTEERLKTIYEVLAPQIVRSEHNWRDYLSFAARFHKHSFDNTLMVYGQNPNVTMLATTKQWNDAGRYVNRGAKGIAVCNYESAKLTVSYLFDVSQTNGRAITPTNWNLGDKLKSELVNRLSYSHGYDTQNFSELLHALSGEAVAENYEQHLQDLSEDTRGHLIAELPAEGFEAQFQELLTDSVSFFIGKRCALPDEAIHTGDGMSTISHFNTIPLIARVGSATTAIAKGILLEIERTIRIINRERTEQHEKKANDRPPVQRERRDIVPEHSGVQQQRGRSAPGPVRQDGAGIPDAESPQPLYDFENGWQSHGGHAPGTGGSDGENRNPDPAASPARPLAADREHDGADEAPEQSQASSRGNGVERAGADSPLTIPTQENSIQPEASGIEPSEQDGSFFIPFSPDAADYPLPPDEQVSDPVGDFNIPDEVADMAGPAYESPDFDRVLAVVAEYERLDEQAALVAEEIPEADTAVQQLNLYDAQPSSEESRKEKQRLPNDAPHRNYRTLEKLFPQLISGEYRYLHLESEGFMPLSLEWVYGSNISIMHTYIQNGDLMRDPDVVVRVDQEEKTVQAVSFQQDGGLPIYQEVMDYEGRVLSPGEQRSINSFLTQWLSNIEWQEYEPVRAVTMENDEEVDLSLTKAAAQTVLLESTPETAELPSPEPPIHLKATDPIQYLEEVTGSHHGQLDVRMQAVMDELTVGVLEYSVFEDVPHVAMIEVLEAYRHQGIATGMVQKLQSQYPNTEIAWGMLTDDGAAFQSAVTYTVPNEQFERVSDDLEDISAKLRIYENDLDNGKILSRRQADDMNELSSIQYRLENELRELEPVQTFVRLPNENRPVLEQPPTDALDEEDIGQELPYAAQTPVLPDDTIRTGTNFHYSPAYGLYPPGAKTKYRNNIEAIRFLKRIEKERRPATSEEQIVLARYVGWGGLANAFSEKAAGWEKEYRELKMLLNDVEYRNALHSTLTAYYTEPELIKRIYTAIGSFGFHGGPDRKMLDPGMGTGNFYSVLPEELAGTKLYGVEIDSITGRIAQQLYPEASIAVAGFQSTWFEPRSFDVILGNPAGNYGLIA